MVLVDTSVWIDHFRNNNQNLSSLLLKGSVSMHEFILGELACGNFKNRNEIFSLLNNISTLPIVTIDEYLYFLDSNHLFGKGIGFVDIHLLASAKLSNIPIWTFDKRLKEISAILGVDYKKK